MINRVVLVGRMTKDPELRRTPSGAAVTSFTLAMNRTFSSNNGERQSDFINCVVWNKAAENVERYCSKGSLVGVEGRLQSRSYDGQDGRRVYVVEVVCDSVQFLETRAMRDNRASQDYSQNSYGQNNYGQSNYGQNNYGQPNNGYGQTNPNQNFFNGGNRQPQNDFGNDFDDLDNTFDIMEDDIQF